MLWIVLIFVISDFLILPGQLWDKSCPIPMLPFMTNSVNIIPTCRQGFIL